MDIESFVHEGADNNQLTFINSVYSVSLQLQFLFAEGAVGWRLTDESLSGL